MRLRARIERRLLVNWRVDAEAVSTLLPDGLRPRLVDGSAVAGVCVLAVSGVRPARVPLPDPLVVVSAAHRAAVEWDGPDGPQQGVFVAARHTRSPFAALLGGRVVPGVQRPAAIEWARGSAETVALRGADDRVALDLGAADRATSSLFDDDLATAAAFFHGGEVAWSHDRAGRLEPLRMRTLEKRLEPLAVRDASSSWIDALPGDAALDSAFVMRDVHVEWDRPDGRTLRPDAPVLTPAGVE